MNFMTKKEILKGLEYRLKNLNETLKVLDKAPDVLDVTVRDYEVRIDEIYSLLLWIEEDKDSTWL